jgi:hypothetical protein
MLNKSFTAKLQKSPSKGGWTYVVWPESVKFFGARGLVKNRRNRRRPSLPKLVHGARERTHKLPIKADARKEITKDVGDKVTVVLKESLN